jgi:hypothetical protein
MLKGRNAIGLVRVPPQYTRRKDDAADVTSKGGVHVVLAVGGSSRYREKTLARVKAGSGLHRRDDSVVAYCNQADQRRGMKTRMLTTGLKAKRATQG